MYLPRVYFLRLKDIIAKNFGFVKPQLPRLAGQRRVLFFFFNRFMLLFTTILECFGRKKEYLFWSF